MDSNQTETRQEEREERRWEEEMMGSLNLDLKKEFTTICLQIEMYQ